MFSLFNGIYDSYLAPSQLNVLIVGGPMTGKSALLERLKVTEIPTRHNKNVQNRLGAEQMTKTLHAAFVETGAIDIAGRRKSSIREMTNNNNNNNKVLHPIILLMRIQTAQKERLLILHQKKQKRQQ